ncbi:cyclopropane-fatty-acyl-phospholipid synthase family protein [Streptomyces sp. UNOB3_S3]|uniref:SAM-dependent methyltransferase n=1 Tax=Streptomyces sp. UNOB3_S3 TaxID=2871682 RepID=UPI001E295A24|nr:class I SAM-dependent methyltransferase [Streptomyces sp. UNOB3_S3]MCC3774371.1 methyltransferase domain-containing protein [Streptomyces sp. UNOB3_S3]
MSTETDATAQFQAFVADPRRRRDEYPAMVEQYFALVGDVYRHGWGPSQHMACYLPGQSREEATEAHEKDLADRAGLTADSFVLDLCSGVGGPACTIAAHTGARVTGIDLVADRVREAQDNARERGLDGRASFRVADATSLPFDDSLFTAAYSFDALCHVPDKPRAHREVARVLRPGAVWTGYDWMRAPGPWADEAAEAICRAHGLSALATVDELRSALTAAGFTEIHVSDGQDIGDWAPNWDLLEKLVAELPPRDELPPLLRMMTDGARAMCEGARSGAFFIGYWHARRPQEGP